jgi:hypothetical protein
MRHSHHNGSCPPRTLAQWFDLTPAGSIGTDLQRILDALLTVVEPSRFGAERLRDPAGGRNPAW